LLGIATANDQLVVEFAMNSSVKLCETTRYPFTKPEHASLDPVVVELLFHDIPLQIWFLGNGYARIEWYTGYFTDKRSWLMMSCTRERGDDEHGSGGDATEEPESEEESDSNL
jgi:hypothetical protein